MQRLWGTRERISIRYTIVADLMGAQHCPVSEITTHLTPGVPEFANNQNCDQNRIQSLRDSL